MSAPQSCYLFEVPFSFPQTKAVFVAARSKRGKIRAVHHVQGGIESGWTE